MSSSKFRLTFQYRVKNPKGLDSKARAVNFVWNYCCETHKKTQHDRRKWLSHFDFNRLLKGTSKEFRLNSMTVQQIAKQFTVSRNTHKKRPRWRSNKKSLGWVPFNRQAIKMEDGFVVYLKEKYPIWQDRPLEGKVVCGSFSQDAKRNWYVNIVCEVEVQPKTPTGKSVGVDLGLKELATLSTGEKVDNPRHYKTMEKKLATAQRAGRKKRVRAIHTKIKNKRKNDLHHLSNKLIKDFDNIYIGNVNSAKLAKTKMAKSIYDVGWFELKSMLRYKAIRHGAHFQLVDERFSTQTCSVCGSVSGPKGLKGLGVREWKCPDCQTSHDRDVNAAKNILLLGQRVALQQTENIITSNQSMIAGS